MSVESFRIILNQFESPRIESYKLDFHALNMIKSLLETERINENHSESFRILPNVFESKSIAFN